MEKCRSTSVKRSKKGRKDACRTQLCGGGVEHQDGLQMGNPGLTMSSKIAVPGCPWPQQSRIIPVSPDAPFVAVWASRNVPVEMQRLCAWRCPFGMRDVSTARCMWTVLEWMTHRLLRSEQTYLRMPRPTGVAFPRHALCLWRSCWIRVRASVSSLYDRHRVPSSILLRYPDSRHTHCVMCGTLV